MDTLKRRIASRSLLPGARLPSIRAMSETLEISKSTVVEAYERLTAEGAITSRRGAGFYVAGATRPLSLAEVGPRLDQTIDPLWVMRQSLTSREGDLAPGCGWLPDAWMPQDAIRRALRAIARHPRSNLTRYDPPLGLAALRVHLAQRLADKNIDAPGEQILLTDSGTQAIDLLCRFFLEPGDTVLVDDPCYFNFQAALRAHRVTAVGVPYVAGGPDVIAFAQAAAQHKPRLYLTNSALHNPTGGCLSPATAHRLLKLIEEHDIIAVEDDIFADFEREPAPRLAALGGLDRVIHIGSFSKTLTAAARCGFIAARPDWIAGLTDLKLAGLFSNNGLSAQLVHHLLLDGTYRRHVESLRTQLAGAMSQVSDALLRAGFTLPVTPRGGMYLWAMLPEGLDATRVAQQALARNMVLAPGNVFSVSGSADRYLRFNVAQSCAPQVMVVLAEAMEAAATSR
jgi:DNA-binding transcriptional MocR family regulator